MKGIKLVFIEAEEEDARRLSGVLGKLQLKDYYFVFVPKGVNVLSLEQVEEMLDKIRGK